MEARIPGGVVLITGAAQGIGARIAERAAESGADALVLTDRQAEAGEAVAARIRRTGCEVEFLAADLAEPEAAGHLTAAAAERFGRIDGLVNAAALTDRASMLDGTVALWDRLFAVNARAPYFLMQGAIADMMLRASPGAIVNICSVNAHCGAPDLAIYSATKGALATLTKNAANAHLADRIRVNGINVGWVATPGERRMQAETLGKGPGWEAEVAAGMPLGRMLEVDEVARLAIYMLSEASGLMTGTVVDLEQRVIGAPG